ncbi:MAG: hypothetical protein MJ231_01225 [bacterium]|nr:hypothetical protein [bacterium]
MQIPEIIKNIIFKECNEIYYIDNFLEIELKNSCFLPFIKVVCRKNYEQYYLFGKILIWQKAHINKEQN